MMKGMVFAERYKLEDFIGQGGMSLVYRAVDIRTGHSVAVKILKSEYNSDKEFLERFQREAQAASLPWSVPRDTSGGSGETAVSHPPPRPDRRSPYERAYEPEYR